MTAAPSPRAGEDPDSGTPSRPPRPRRLIELLLLVLSWVIGIGGMCLVDLELAESLDHRIVSAAVVLVVGSLVIHVILRAKAKYADPFILPIAVALNGIGLALIYRVGLTTSAKVIGSQTVWSGLGMVV